MTRIIYAIMCIENFPKESGITAKPGAFIDRQGGWSKFSSNTHLYTFMTEARGILESDYMWGRIDDYAEIVKLKVSFLRYHGSTEALHLLNKYYPER